MNLKELGKIKKTEFDILRNKIEITGVNCFARMAGIDAGYISRVKNGKRYVSLEEIVKLGEVVK